jgi:hypothetical protein
MLKQLVNPDYKREENAKKEPKKTVAQAVVTKAEESEQEETRTPLVPSYSYGHSGVDLDVVISLSVVGGILLTVGLLITFGCVFNWGWTFFQWLIGIVGGLFLFAVVSLIVFALNDDSVVDYYSLGSILLAIFIVVSSALLFIFTANYKVIFGCFSFFELVGGLILVFQTFSDYEEEWGTFQVVEIIVIIIAFILAMIFA